MGGRRRRLARPQPRGAAGLAGVLGNRDDHRGHGQLPHPGDDVDGLHAELAGAGVLHPVDEGRPGDTDHGTREFPTLDRDGNLLTFYCRS